MSTHMVLTCPYCGVENDTHTEIARSPHGGEQVSICARCFKPSVLINNVDGDPMALRQPDICETLQIVGSPQYMAISGLLIDRKPIIAYGLAKWITEMIKEHDGAHDSD